MHPGMPRNLIKTLHYLSGHYAKRQCVVNKSNMYVKRSKSCSQFQQMKWEFEELPIICICSFASHFTKLETFDSIRLAKLKYRYYNYVCERNVEYIYYLYRLSTKMRIVNDETMKASI